MNVAFDLTKIDPTYETFETMIRYAGGSTVLCVPEEWVESAFEAAWKWDSGRLSSCGLVIDWQWIDGYLFVTVKT